MDIERVGFDGAAWMKETYERIFAHSGAGDPKSKKYGTFPVFAFGLWKLLPCHFNAFLELKLTLAHDTSKLTDALKDINPDPAGLTDVLKEIATVGSLHFGVSKSF